MGAVSLHHRSVSPASGAPLRGRVSGVSLLQSHRRENARLANHFAIAPQHMRCKEILTHAVFSVHIVKE